MPELTHHWQMRYRYSTATTRTARTVAVLTNKQPLHVETAALHLALQNWWNENTWNLIRELRSLENRVTKVVAGLNTSRHTDLILILTVSAVSHTNCFTTINNSSITKTWFEIFTTKYFREMLQAHSSLSQQETLLFLLQMTSAVSTIAASRTNNVGAWRWWCPRAEPTISGINGLVSD